jgi:hypothetical protein
VTTTNKDFRVKNGLIVEGNYATVNGNQVITSADAANYALKDAANTFTGGVQQITTANASTKGLIVKGTTSQTANLQEWQDSTGNVIAFVYKDGISIQNNQTNLPRGLTITQSSADIAGAAFIARKSRGTNESPVVVNTGDIVGAFGFTSYNGTTYPTDTTLFGASVTAKSGSTISQSLFFTTGASNVGGNYVPNLLVYHDGRVGIGSGFGNITSTINQPSATLQVGSLAAATPVTIIKGAVSQTASLQEWHNSAGSALAYVDAGGSIRSAIFGSLSLGLTTMRTAYDTNGIGFQTGSATQKGIIVRGFASQTANLQEWQSSAGTVLSNINNVGAANFVRAGIGGATPTTTALFVTATSASGIAVIARAAAAQTANIQEWQITDGTVRSFINPIGRMGVRLSEMAVGTESLSVGTVNTTDIGIVVRGVAAQTANLQEWQNSSGTILSAVDKAGNLTKGDGDQLVLAGQIYG